MKNTLATTLFLLTSVFSFGQNNMNLIDVTSSSGAPSSYFYYCDTTISIDLFADSVNSIGADINGLITSTSFEPSPLEVSVTWGDGSSSTHTGNVISPGQAVQFTPAITHSYGSGGSFNITYSVTNTDNQSSANDAVTVSVGNLCYFDFYSFAQVDCDSNGVAENTLNSGVPILLTNLSTGTTFLDTLNTNQILFTGIPVGNYSYEVEPGWLATNGYNAYYGINNQSIYIDSLNSTFTTQITLHCEDSTSQSQQNCIYGNVFCDANQNGMWDPGEQYIPNVPINVYPYNSSSFTITTDQNGYFQSNYQDPNTGGQQYTVVEVNNNWLTQNGYGSGYYLDTVLNTTCGQGDTISFGIQCPASIDTNCISGYVYCDDNNNYSFDNNESPITNAPVILQMGSYDVTVYTDSFGYYNYCSTQIPINSTYIASLDSTWIYNNGYTVNANNYIPVMSTPSPSLNGNGISVNCNGGSGSCTDLWAGINPWIGYYQNQNNYISLNWGSYGTGIVGNYELSLTFPSNTTPNTSSFANQNYTISGNTITWTLNENTSTFYESDIISFFTSSGIPSGTSHVFTITITPLNGTTDCNSSNNNMTLLQLVGNSYDPNDKLVDHVEEIDPNVVDTLTYTVRFQNTGTAPAQDVYILDTIDSKLNYSTLEVITASHSMNLIELGNNIVRFDFPNIWLPDSNANEPLSHGYVTYRIVESEANSIEDSFTNTAHIYFDWNPAIVTNTTYNINVEPLSTNNLKADKVKVYPNPARNVVNIETVEVAEKIKVVDMNGRTVKNIVPNQNREKVDLTSIETGIYIIQVYSLGELTSYKLIKK